MKYLKLSLLALLIANILAWVLFYFLPIDIKASHAIAITVGVDVVFLVCIGIMTLVEIRIAKIDKRAEAE